MYKPNTLKDIAEGLGVSISTVSRALSDNYQISDKTKRIVKERAETMKYKPNPFAVTLKNSRNYSLGVVVSSVNNTFFSQVIDGIESVAYRNGYHVIITQSHESAVREAENIRHLMENRVDGILISLAAGTTNHCHINEYQSTGSPIVFFDRVLEECRAHKIISNNIKGAYEGVEYLIKSGCKKIMFLGSVEYLSIVQQRKLGCQQALVANNLMSEELCIRYCGFEDYAENIEAVLTALLKSGNKPDAIFSACENTTFGCLRVLKKLRLAHEIKLAGFSNTDVSELLSPSPNFIKQNAFKMGKVAAEKLIASIEGVRYAEEFETVMLETVLEN